MFGPPRGCGLPEQGLSAQRLPHAPPSQRPAPLQLSKFAEGEEVSLESLEENRIVNLSGRESRLPLKVRAGAGATQLVSAHGGRLAGMRHGASRVAGRALRRGLG